MTRVAVSATSSVAAVRAADDAGDLAAGDLERGVQRRLSDTLGDRREGRGRAASGRRPAGRRRPRSLRKASHVRTVAAGIVHYSLPSTIATSMAIRSARRLGRVGLGGRDLRLASGRARELDADLVGASTGPGPCQRGGRGRPIGGPSVDPSTIAKPSFVAITVASLRVDVVGGGERCDVAGEPASSKRTRGGMSTPRIAVRASRMTRSTASPAGRRHRLGDHALDVAAGGRCRRSRSPSRSSPAASTASLGEGGVRRPGAPAASVGRHAGRDRSHRR